MGKFGNLFINVIGVIIGVGMMIKGETDLVRFTGGPIILLINGYLIYRTLKDYDSWN